MTGIPAGAVSTRPVTVGEQYAASGYQATGEPPTLYGPNGDRLTAEDFSPTAFGPGPPLMPRIRALVEPRAWQYPIAFNLIPTPRGEDRTQLDFDRLRYYAGAWHYVATALRYRTQRMIGAKWTFAPAGEDNTPAARKKFAAQIKRLTDWWKMPNRVDRVGFSTWLGQSVREALTTDALTYYRMPTRSGDLHSLVQIDGARIKLLIDTQAHLVGYQQVLYGFPQSEWPVYGSDWIDYVVLNPQVNSAYGLSPMEEIRPLIDLGIFRTLHQMAWYQQGTTPAGFIEDMPDQWSKKNITEFQDLLDDEFGGNVKRRAGMLAIPGKYKPSKPFEFNKDEEEAAISAVCAHFSVPRSLFVSKVSRASAEQESDNTEDVGHKPMCLAFAEFVNRVSRERLDMPDDLEFKFIDERAGNEKEKAEAMSLYVGSDILSPDEVRAREFGLDPKEPNEPTTPVLPNGQPALDAAGRPVAPAPGSSSRGAASGAGGAPPAGKTGGGAASSEGDDKEAKAEVATWRKFALKRVERGRHADTFEARALPSEVAAAIAKGLSTARDRDAVQHVFDEAIFSLPHFLKRKRLTETAKRQAESRIAAALKRNFDDEKARLKAHYAAVRGAA